MSVHTGAQAWAHDYSWVQRRTKMHKRAGFTLIELLVVIAIM